MSACLGKHCSKAGVACDNTFFNNTAMPEAPAIMELQPRSSDASGLPAAKLPAAAESTTKSSPNASDAPPHQDTGLSALRAGIIAAAVTGILVASSMTTGLLTVALPKMATDLDIPEHLLLWYGLPDKDLQAHH